MILHTRIVRIGHTVSLDNNQVENHVSFVLPDGTEITGIFSDGDVRSILNLSNDPELQLKVHSCGVNKQLQILEEEFGGGCYLNDPPVPKLDNSKETTSDRTQKQLEGQTPLKMTEPVIQDSLGYPVVSADSVSTDDDVGVPSV